MSIELKTKLRDKTLYLLVNRRRTLTLEDIEKDTTLPVHWLSSFLKGQSKDPSVSRIETLYEYLSGNTLDV